VNLFRALYVGTGQLPPSLRAELTAEGLLFLAEGLNRTA
jgi:hypothetical protein